MSKHPSLGPSLNADEQMTADFAALASAARRELPTFEQTERRLMSAAAERKGVPMPLTKRPLFLTFATCAVLLVALFAPVPYNRTIGYDLTFRSADGKSHQLHLGDVSAKAAQRRADLVHRRTGAQVAVAPVRARRWGSVYAMVQSQLTIAVDTDGKSDAEVQDEIAAQLAQAGWDAEVHVGSSNGWSTVDISADDGAGGKMQIIRQVSGDSDAAKHIDLQLGGLPANPTVAGAGEHRVEITADHRLSDADLQAQIEAKLKADGVTDAQVTVKDGKVQVEMRKEAPTK